MYFVLILVPLGIVPLLFLGRREWRHSVISSGLSYCFCVPPVLVFLVAGRAIAIAVSICVIDVTYVHVVIAWFVLQIGKPRVIHVIASSEHT